MEVRPAFKQTEIGAMPGDWEPVTTAEIVDPNAPICYGVVQVGEDTNDGVPIVAIKYVKEISSAPLHRASLAVEQPYTRSRVSGGDVLISIKGTIGRVGVVPTGFEGNISRELARLRPRSGYAAEYIAQQLESQATQARISRAVVGTTRLELSIATLRTFEIPVPKTLTEQRAIATALSDVNALLGGLDRLIAKKRDLKQAAMQQLLTGQTRLPGFHGDWEMKRMGDICEISVGRTPPRLNQAFWGRGYTWLSIADLQSKVVSESKEEITALAASTMTIIPKGTLLMSFKLSIGRLCFAGRDLFTNEAICGFNNLQANPEFLYYALSRTDFSLYGKQAVKGYTLNKESLKLIEVRLPSSAEQDAVAAVLSDMDAELEALEARRDKIRGLKQAMMQELLTGKTRLVSAENADA
jgi:type I restriction enzyme S subunit